MLSLSLMLSGNKKLPVSDAAKSRRYRSVETGHYTPWSATGGGSFGINTDLQIDPNSIPYTDLCSEIHGKTSFVLSMFLTYFFNI